MELFSICDVQRDLARRVRRERLRSNLTQKALSERAQVGEVTVRRLEGGQGISLHNYLKVAFALGAFPSASDLLPQREPQTLEDVRPVTRKRARKRAQTR